MKKPSLKVKSYRHPKYKFVVDLRAFKKGRSFFKTRTEAEAEALRHRILLERHSGEAVGLTRREMSDFIHARERLAVYGKTISDVVEGFCDHQERVLRHGITVSQLANEVVGAKLRDGLSKSYLADLRKRFSHFSRDFGTRPIAGITVEELDNWLRDLPLSQKSRANYRAVIGVLFSYAKRRRMIDINPVEFTARPKLIDKAPEIFKVDELRVLLEAANQTAPDIVPMLAIGAFAGLRDAEIKRLDWSEVDLARGHIEVTAAKAKSAQRRFIPIQPNLAAWLRPFSGMTGLVVPARARGKLARVKKLALDRWPNNGLRHSFASYHLAHFKNAATTALELGHSNSAMLYAHYRELVLPEEARRYWEIKPVAEEERVVAFRQP